MDGVWQAQNTSPAEIEAALRRLLHERYESGEAFAPARVLNLVVVIDRSYRGEILGRLERIGRNHPSRTVVCAVEPRRRTIDAWATMESTPPAPGRIGVCREQVELTVGERHLPHLATVVDPVLVPDLATCVWAPHGHTEAIDSMLRLADVVLVDSADELDSAAALARVAELREHVYVVDLAWLRSAPWRERLASAFDPPAMRPALQELSAVKVRARAGSEAAAFLFVGWMASRLGWTVGRLEERDGALRGFAHRDGHEVELKVESMRDLTVPGLDGVLVDTDEGVGLNFARGPGGLRTARRLLDGRVQEWTIMGASRGEGGILGEGVRQALLRDPTYAPALEAARALVA